MTGRLCWIRDGGAQPSDRVVKKQNDCKGAKGARVLRVMRVVRVLSVMRISTVSRSLCV